MNLSYSLRLACLGLAAFFLVHLAIGSGLTLLAPVTIRWAERLRAGPAAALLFAARLAPAVVGLLMVMLICVPSYLLFEPEGGVEQVGAFCVAGALLCLLGWGLAIARTARAAVCSLEYMRYCRRDGHETWLAGQPWWVVEECSPGLAVLGLWRPQFVISASLARVLPTEELAAALRHERAHGTARDNVKRLLFLLTPDLLPALGGFGRLERGWARFAEWTADDRATAGDPQLALSLAAALVRVARVGIGPAVPPLMSTLVTGRCNLAERVNRLLDPEPPSSPWIPQRVVWMSAGSLLVAIGAMLPVAMNASRLNHLYRVLEACMH